MIETKEQEAWKYHDESVKEFFELMHDIHHLNRRELNRMIVSDEEGNRMCQNFKNIIKEIKDEGHAEGHAERMIEVIRRLKEANIAMETMMIATGLIHLEVQSILTRL